MKPTTRDRARAQGRGFEKTTSATVLPSAVSAYRARLQVRMLAALQDAEALALAGRRVSYCLARASESHAISCGELAALWIAKRIECDRARAVVAGMREGDDDAHEGGR